MGAFDDLIPQQSALPGAPKPANPFADLIPPGAPSVRPVPAPNPGRAAAVADIANNTTLDVPTGTDVQSGAPIEVRMVVGTAAPQDQLANIQRYFPDAKPVLTKGGQLTSNFVFTNPKTGKLTLYNPLGLDKADVPSAGKDFSQAAGATLGGAVGAIESIPSFGLGAPVLVPVMSGIGAAAGGETWDAVMQHFLGQIDTRTLPQKLTEDGIVAGTTALGSAGGALIGQGAKAVSKPVGRMIVGPEAEQRLGDMLQTGVTPSLGTVSNNRIAQGAQTVLGYYPSSVNVIGDAAERNVDEIASAATRLAQRYGGSQELSITRAGEALKTGAQEAAQRFTTRQGQLYDAAYNMVGADTPISLDNVRRLYAELYAQVNQAPNSLAGTGQGLQRVAAVLRDAVDPNTGAARPISFEIARRIRTEIGRELDDPIVAGSTGAANDVRRQLYGALTADLNATAGGQSQDALRLIQQADRYTRYQMGQNVPTLQKLQDAATPEKAFADAFAGAKEGGTTLLRIRRNMTPEQWDVVAGTQLGRLGTAVPSAQGAAGDTFSVNTFLTNWAKLSPEAKDAAFSGTRYAALRPELDRLASVAEDVKNLSKFSNPSGTARVLLYGRAGASLLGFWMAPLMTTAAITIPYGGARLMTNPQFVRWLVQASTSPTALAPNGLAANVGRLWTIARQNPDIAKDVGAYAEALQKGGNSAPQDRQP